MRAKCDMKLIKIDTRFSQATMMHRPCTKNEWQNAQNKGLSCLDLSLAYFHLPELKLDLINPFGWSGSRGSENTKAIVKCSLLSAIFLPLIVGHRESDISRNKTRSVSEVKRRIRSQSFPTARIFNMAWCNTEIWHFCVFLQPILIDRYLNVKWYQGK